MTLLESPCEKTHQTTGSFPTFIIADTCWPQYSDKNTQIWVNSDTTGNFRL